jgi:hypothetical protein
MTSALEGVSGQRHAPEENVRTNKTDNRWLDEGKGRRAETGKYSCK